MSGYSASRASATGASTTGILEETPGVAQHGGVGEFRAADGAHRLADVAQRGAAAGLDLAFDVAVPEPGRGVRESSSSTAVMMTRPLEGVFEDAFAVSESAVCGVEREHRRGFDAEHLHAADRIGGFGPVGSDILHGGGAGLPGDEREVFQPPEAAFDGPLHEVVPLDPGFGPHAECRAALFEGRDLSRNGREEQTVVVLRKEDVVASGEDHPARGDSCGEYFAQVIGVFELDEALRPLLYAETVAVAQADLVKFSDHDAQSYE